LGNISLTPLLNHTKRVTEIALGGENSTAATDDENVGFLYFFIGHPFCLIG
jgi:uncharacterized protein YjdB